MSEPERQQRGLTVREQAVRNVYTSILTRKDEDGDSTYQAAFKVKQQSFRVGPEYETQGEAEWMRTMLTIALTRMIRFER